MAKEEFEDEAGGGGGGEGGDEQEHGGVVTERLRQRNKRRPVYVEEDDGMDDEDWEAHLVEDEEEEEEEDDDEDGDGERSGRKMEQSEDFCDKCNSGGDLLCCDTCPAVFHLGCLDPPMKVVPRGKWSCPKCADPLGDVEKFIDVQMRPIYVPVEDSEPVVADKASDQDDERASDQDDERASDQDDEKASDQDADKASDQDGDKPPEQAADKTPEQAADKTSDRAAEKTSDQVGDEASVSAPPKDSETPPPKLVKQYLVKWKSRSYLHCSWVTVEDLERGMKTFPGLRMKLSHFHKSFDASKNTGDEDRLAIRPEWTTVDRVLDARTNDDDVTEYLVKWKELGYDEATWEVEEDISTFQAEVEKYKEIMSRQSKKKRKGPALDQKDLKRRKRDFKPFKKTPDFLVGGVLHPYQLEGLNFLRFAWEQNKHVILADEMGLGKTIQSIALLASLIETNVGLPHLVVAPLSTLRNWDREFATWAPQMNVVMYVGTSPARAKLREYEFFFPRTSSRKKDKGKKKSGDSKQDRIKFDVLLTSYEMINFDTSILKALKWECLIVDEGHRLKNKDSKLFQTLTTFTTTHRVLLTGTPLQNNLDELFMLMHFLDAGKFQSLEEFQQEFQDINQEEQVGRLHKMLAPHLLRRVKKDVLREMPPKKELILRVELSPLQKEFYKAILTKNFHVLCRHGGTQISLSNVVMELRKLCGHPYLIDGVEPDVGNQAEANRQFMENSGKLVVLDKMMEKLQAQGHRVLIYSQFTRMLDILEDWMNMKMWSYERIDGKISGSERQIRIDRYNAPNSTKFCFLLSTRAGGLGINLATADTVIIYDSDWNPHADLQAMARAHRLGQQNKVMIFRLVTRGTIEERMMQMTKKKMVLEHLVVGRMKKDNINQEELDDILRYGALEMFSENEDDGKDRQIHYDDAAIDRLLDRDQVIAGEEKVEEEEDNDLLKAFKVANFDYIDEEAAVAGTAPVAEEPESEAGKQDPELEGQRRAQFWDTLLKDRVAEAQAGVKEELGKGKRSRRQAKAGLYSEENDLAGMNTVHSDDEQEPNSSPVAEPNSPDYQGNTGDVTVGKKIHSTKKRPRERVTGEPPPLMEGDGRELRVLGFNHKQRTNFVNVLLRFGLGDFTWSEFVPRLKPKTHEEIKEYGTLFLSHIAEDINGTAFFSDGVPKEGLRIQDVLVRLAILHLMRDKCKAASESPGMLLFRGGEHMYRYYSLRNTKVWKEEHDKKLLFGICQKHGYGRWASIIEDPHLALGPVIRSELLLRGVSDSAGPSKNGEARPGEMEDPSGREEGKPGFSFGGDKEDKENDFKKRMVDFVKRRVLVLEKVLNAEYHSTGRFPPLPDIPHPGTPNQSQEQVQAEEPPPQVMMNEPVMRSHETHMRSHDPGMRAHQAPQMMNDHGMRGYQTPQMNDPGTRSYQTAPQMMTNDPMFRHHQSPQMMSSDMRAHQQPQYYSQMRSQERHHSAIRHPVPITQEEINANMYDNDEGRLRVAQLYNQICVTITENEGDAIQAYSGNKSAGLRVRKVFREVEILCSNMRDALYEQPLEGADPNGAQSEEDFHEDMDRDSDVEGEVAAAEPRPAVREYQFLKIPSQTSTHHVTPPPHGTPFVFLDS